MYTKNIAIDNHAKSIELVAKNKDLIKAHIKLASSIEEVDKILAEYAGLYRWQEKLACLQGMFGARVIFDASGTEGDYQAVVEGIIRRR